jgi:hypothetical protein
MREYTMKNRICEGMVFLTVAGALALCAQTPQPAAPAPASTPAAQGAPSADDIVAKYVDAVGGKAAISQIKSVTMETSMQIMGSDAPGTTTILDGVGYKQETDFNGSMVVQCFNDKGGWQVNPMAGAADPTPMSDQEYKNGKDGIYVGSGLYDYAAKGSKVELVSSSDDGYKIKLTNKDGVESSFTIDPKTYLIKSLTRKGQLQGQDVDITISYSDYRKTDTGYLMPYQLGLDLGGQFQMSIAVKKIELNKTIDPAIFAMPKPAAAPAPAAPPATQ